MIAANRTGRTWWLGGAVSLALACAAAAAVATDKPADKAKEQPAHEAKAPPAKDQAALDKWFADLLTGAELVGQYTAGDEKTPKDDTYTILKAVKGDGDHWVITAKIAYKGIGVPKDITVPVRWSGDTPVIQLTDETVMGMGPFTVRLMFHGDQYAGMWSSPKHGGLMWGKVEHPAKAGAAARPATEPAQ